MPIEACRRYQDETHVPRPPALGKIRQLETVDTDSLKQRLDQLDARLEQLTKAIQEMKPKR